MDHGCSSFFEASAGFSLQTLLDRSMPWKSPSKSILPLDADLSITQFFFEVSNAIVDGQHPKKQLMLVTLVQYYFVFPLI